MKVLWFSNCILGNEINRGSGSWLYAMRSIISSEVELYNITQSHVSDIVLNKYDDLIEYVLPSYNLVNNVPLEREIKSIVNIVDTINPDIIHIWGIELYWGLLFSRGYIKRKYILEIQGLLSSCYNVYYGGLTPAEIVKCFSIKEILKYNSYLPFVRKKIEKRSFVEYEIIHHSSFISTQSEWVRNQIRFIVNAQTTVVKTLLPIRDSFYKSNKWKKTYSNKSITLFTSFSYLVPFKGLHLLIKGLSILKKKYDNIILNVGGIEISSVPFYRKDGYLYYILSLIKRYNLQENINFLGKLNEEEIIKELLISDVYINPSFVESYSVASAEAMFLGVPSVLSYAGAMPDFSNKIRTALYYSPMDYIDLSSKIALLIENNQLATTNSSNSIRVLEDLSDKNKIKTNQLTIYSTFLQNTNINL